MNGYTGRVLRIDLSKGKIRVLEDKYQNEYERFIGGSGLAARILFDEVEPGVEPFGPKNKLVFMTGPLTGTGMTSTRYAVVGKSPLTGIYGEATASGHWGPQLKMAGYDGIIVEGSAKDPVYLSVDDENLEIRDASHLWGKTVHEVGNILKEEIKGKGFKALSIGPAGERLARIAAIIECYHGSAAARCGLGAVMGAKKLKAIVARGTSTIKVADEKKFMTTLRDILRILAQNTEDWRLYGTNSTGPAERVGDLPIKNWTVNSWREGAEKIGGETMTKTMLRKAIACNRCPVACKRDIEIKEGPYAGTEGHGPEYETVAGFGSMLLVNNLEAIAYENDLCTAYGLDTISCGAVVAFAAECYEKGIITKNDTDGLDLTWGNHRDFARLVHMIGERSGIGRLLGEGSRVASQKLGKDSGKFAMHVKGLELPSHDPRAYESIALGYATANRGADHLTACSHWVERNLTIPELGYKSILDRFVTDGKAELVVKMQNYMAVMDSLVVCKFDLQCGVTYTQLSEMLSAVTGIEWTIQKLQESGERIYNLKRAFNVRESISRKDDTVPQRVLTKPIVEGATKEHVPNLERMLDEYYKLRGWDAEGIPTEGTLRRLGLS
jgi:aldehyde:ferredoxin oxidoreductase